MSSDLIAFITRFASRTTTQSKFEQWYPSGYTGVGGVDASIYPNILAQGEIVVCVDIPRILMGTMNGEYIELTTSAQKSGELQLRPISVTLPPSAGFNHIPHLDSSYDTLLLIKYSLTDNIDGSWVEPGGQYSKSGMLRIAAVTGMQPTMEDTGVEISEDYNRDIFFKVSSDMSATHIKVLYRHDYPWPLRLTTASIEWVPQIQV